MHVHVHVCIDVYATEGMAISELSEKNRAASTKWCSMTQEDKQRYFQLAMQVPTMSSPSDTTYKWHETQRILSNLQDNVS